MKKLKFVCEILARPHVSLNCSQCPEFYEAAFFPVETMAYGLIQHVLE